MSNCANNNLCDQTPIGSPAPDACSPCGNLTEESAVGMLKELLARQCALETKVNNWHLLLQRERNRTSALERKPASAAPSRSTVSVDVCSGDQFDEVDSLVSCKDGTSARLNLPECHVPVGLPSGAVGSRPIGPTFLPAAVVLKSGSFGNTSYSYPMAAYEIPDCAKYAIVEVTLTGQSSSAGAMSATLYCDLISGFEARIAYIICGPSDNAGFVGIVRVPIVGGALEFRASLSALVFPARSLGIKLLGFE